MALINAIGIFISSNLSAQAPPFGSTDIVSELNVQMVDEVNSDDLITETT